MTTVDNQSDSEEQKHPHPISPDIVLKIARDLNIRRQLLDDVLTDMEELWEPYRNELRRMTFVAGDPALDFWVDRYPIEDADVTVLGGDDPTVIDLLRQIDLEARLREESVSKFGMAHAVWVAHKQETERHIGYIVERPVVIRQQE